MARAIATASLLVSMMVAAPAQAEDLEAVAVEAGVEPVHLAGAVNSTGLEPRLYLQVVGELARPAPVRSVWDRLAACESTSRWNVNTGNGYYGGLQQDLVFWRRHGGLAFASRPDLASREQQVAVAERGLAVQGWGAWPVCSRRLGLR